jgi:hypothetical protein
MASSELLKQRELGIEAWPTRQPAPEIEPGNPLATWVARYYDHPDLFAAEVLDQPLDDNQAKIALDVADGHREISVVSSVGCGKTRGAALIALWFVCTRNPAKVILTAPGAPQLHDSLLPELKTLFNCLPDIIRRQFDVQSDRIQSNERPDAVFISARTASAEKPEIMQGVHAENILLIVDEASGVRDETLLPAMGIMSSPDACMVLISNPTRLLGFFADSHRKVGFADRFRHHHMNYLNSPRVSHDYVDMIRARYGEESNEFRVRCLGLFPTGDVDAFIALESVEAAMARDSTPPPSHERVWALDVARQGDDDCALVERIGQHVEILDVWHGNDLMLTASKVAVRYTTMHATLKPSVVVVDSIGIGAGVVDRLRALDIPVRGINVGESPSVEGRYYNLRAELWDRVKQGLVGRTLRLPKDERLLRELIAPRYEYTADQRLKIESKKDMRSRGIGSPDIADAVCLSFAVKASILYGDGVKLRRAKPVRRTGAVC